MNLFETLVDPIIEVNMPAETRQIESETVQRIIALHCNEHAINLPAQFRKDMTKCLGTDWSLNHFGDVKKKICVPLQTTLDQNSEAAEKYGDLLSRIRAPIRLRLACAMGFDAYVKNPVKGGGPSVREVLIGFLKSLAPGEQWNQEKLRGWSSSISGETLIRRITHILGMGLTQEVIRIILGDNADILLMRNPCKFQHHAIDSRYDACRYLTEFLESKPTGDPWSLIELRNWRAADGVSGETLRLWIQNNYGAGTFSEEKAAAVLGDTRAKRLLKGHKLESGIVKNRNEKQEVIARALRIFMRSLPGRSWNTQTLKDHGTITDNITGQTVYDWLRNHKGGLTRDVVNDVLKKDGPRLLAYNPLDKNNARTVVNRAQAKKYLVLFFGLLLENEPWHSEKLRKFGEISDGVTGETVYSWILNNESNEGEGLSLRAVSTILGDDSTPELATHPLKPAHVEVVTGSSIAAKYLGILLYSLPEGTSFSTNTLLDYGEIADGVNGNTLYSWIISNCADGYLTEDVIKILLGEEADELIARNRFERERKIIPIKTVADVKKYFADFLRRRREKSWAPIDLIKAPIMTQGGPTGLEVYWWLQRNIRHGNTINWLFILTNIISKELFAKHPFIHERWGKFDIGTIKINEGALLTGRPEIGAMSDGRGVEDEAAASPLALLLAKVEERDVENQQKALQEALLLLDQADYQCVMNFYAGKKSPQKKLQDAIRKLRTIIESTKSL